MARNISKKRKFVADGVFFAELSEVIMQPSLKWSEAFACLSAGSGCGVAGGPFLHAASLFPQCARCA